MVRPSLKSHPMPATLRCFVAMAFSHEDTDKIYRVIRRTLKPLHINVQRVDGIEHNDNIDIKIIKELEAADLVVADLTYARLSVYFEAGYARRRMPVIYTARRDHFKEHPDDVYGNRHVHFDLKICATSSTGHRRTIRGSLHGSKRRRLQSDCAARP